MSFTDSFLLRPVTVMECDSTVTENNTYIQSADYPAAAPAGMCMYNLNKCDSNICQFRLEFEDVEMGAPASGDCNNDTMMVRAYILHLNLHRPP